MRRIFVFLLFVLLCTNIWCVSYQSNCLGQKTGEADSDIDNSKWVITEEGDVSVLYLNGEAKKRFWTNKTENSEVTTVQNLEDNSVLKTFFKDGFPLRTTKESGGTTTVTTFQFSDGNLDSTICEQDGKVIWAEYYRREPSDGSLMSVSRYDSQSLLGNSYVWDNGNLVNIISSDFAINDDFTINDSGNVVIEKDGVVTEYDPHGLPVSQKTQDSETTWVYEEGKLVSKTTVKGSEKSVDFYTDDVVSSNIMYNGESIVSQTDYGSDEVVKTVYSEGKPLAKIYYLPDGKHINRIVYL